VSLVELSTHGDERLELPIAALGARGVFTTAIDQAVLDGRADAAVHSAKDLPSSGPSRGLVIAAVPVRADVRDCLVGRSLADLAPGAAVATGSARRRVQLAGLRPDLSFVELRGNIATRLAAAPDGGAAVVAYAALERLDLLDAVREVLAVEVMCPQVGQGAIAVRCREEDEAVRTALAAIDDPAAHLAVRAERAYLARLGGGCEAPVGALAEVRDGAITLTAMLAREADGRVCRRTSRGEDPEVLGAGLAEALAADLATGAL
jgi:hydroxymethylbilane synthase